MAKKNLKSSSSLDQTKSSPKNDEPQGASLNNFRETLKEVLEDITSLEVNTIIVNNIPIRQFDPQEFYVDLMEKLSYRTEKGLQKVKDRLLDENRKLKDQELSLPYKIQGPLPSGDSLIIKNAETEYLEKCKKYNQDLEKYKEAEKLFYENKNSLDEEKRAIFEMEQACYLELEKQISRFNIELDEKGNLIKRDAKGNLQDAKGKSIDGALIRHLRKLWEFEQSVLNGERIYAQTKFHLDGDVTNRFLEELFIPNKTQIDPRMIDLVFELHRQGVKNAQDQWSGLINICVDLVERLLPSRSANK